MNYKETANLLNYVAAVKNWRPTNPKEILNSWLTAFADYDAGTIYKATRYVVEHSPYIPQIADVKKALNKGELLYGSGLVPKAIEAPTHDLTSNLCKGSSICPYFESDMCHGTKGEVASCVL